MLQIEKKPEPQPVGFRARLAGHHWVQEIDFDGHVGGTIVLQWNPSVKRWSHSGNVGTGGYVEIPGWKYIGICPMPGEFPDRDTITTRDFSLTTDVQGDFKPIDGLCQFFYKDYQISISTAGMSHGACHVPICIFDRHNTDRVVKDGFSTVEEAIDWINDPNKEI